MKRPRRKVVASFGTRGNRRILVVKDGAGYLTERYVSGRPKRKTFGPDKRGAIAWAERWYLAGSSTPVVDLTLRELFDRYIETVSSQKNWRGSTVNNVKQHRKRLEQALGPDSRVNTYTLAHMDELWAKLLALPMAPNQVRAKVKLLQRVFTFGHSRELVPHNKPAGWSVPEVKALDVEEYRAEDTERLLATFDYQRSGWEWRAWGLILLMSSHGFRVNAALNLRWSDVDLELGVIRLRAATDKTKRDWERPMTFEAYSVLLTARHHADRLSKTSPFVFYGLRERPYTYQAFHVALQKAERAAGVPHSPYRAAHGFRRQAVGDIRAATGDHALGLHWVGDRDLRQAKSYVKTRVDEMDQIAATRGVES